LHVTPDAVASVGVQVKALASQTGNLQEWRDSADNILARVTSTGALHVQSILRQGTASTSVTLNGPWTFNQGTNSEGIVIGGEATAAQNLLRCRNSAGNRRMEIDPTCDLRIYNIWSSLGQSFVLFHFDIILYIIPRKEDRF
jgi:hypothetical protein